MGLLGTKQVLALLISYHFFGVSLLKQQRNTKEMATKHQRNGNETPKNRQRNSKPST